VRYFLFTLLVLIPFLSTAQDSTVHIQPSTARYFLEIEDEMYLLRAKDTICQTLVLNLNTQLLVKDRIIGTYQSDSVSNSMIIWALNEKIDARDKKIAGHKWKMALVIILAVLVEVARNLF
jgi:hypothetical protein